MYPITLMMDMDIHQVSLGTQEMAIRKRTNTMICIIQKRVYIRGDLCIGDLWVDKGNMVLRLWLCHLGTQNIEAAHQAR
jgi:hypothetical protein